MRARNPVLMSMQSGPTGGGDGGGDQGLTGGSHGAHVLNPLGNRSLSPANYQQLQSSKHHSQQ